MAAKLIKLTHKIAIQLHLMARSCTICTVLAPGGQFGNFWIYLHIQADTEPTVKFIALLPNVGIHSFHHVAYHPRKSAVIYLKFHLQCFLSSPLCCEDFCREYILSYTPIKINVTERGLGGGGLRDHIPYKINQSLKIARGGRWPCLVDTTNLPQQRPWRRWTALGYRKNVLHYQFLDITLRTVCRFSVGTTEFHDTQARFYELNNRHSNISRKF
jgi:hypothetical protein